jgi:predicted transport protein
MNSPADMMAAVTSSMCERTGRTLEEWAALVAASPVDPLDQNAVRAWLRDTHGLKQNTQWAIADAAARAAGWERPGFESYVDSQYVGAKAALRPIYDRLAVLVLGLGEDVRAEGRATYVPFVRGRQFAAVQAATAKRVDLGLRFTAPPDDARLVPAKAPGSATHKVSLTDVDQVDGGIEALLLAAYEQNA